MTISNIHNIHMTFMLLMGLSHTCSVTAGYLPVLCILLPIFPHLCIARFMQHVLSPNPTPHPHPLGLHKM